MVYAFGRSLSYVDIFSRSLDYVKLERSDTNLSQEQAKILPSLKNLQPGTMQPHQQNSLMLMSLHTVTFKEYRLKSITHSASCLPVNGNLYLVVC